ncbi:MAG: hypothetical protein GPJ54_06650 [Candidatus Heimdallarchaeota archaeon]|nr:hypothetical protein [Candidatus Heimdallarchaeota archaeon]
MIVLSNSVLSAFYRLNLVSELKDLKSFIYITPEIVGEYSTRWLDKLPSLIVVQAVEAETVLSRSNLSESDLSVINLAIQLKCQLATDDLEIRKVANEYKIPVTGSLGILKSLYLKNIISNKGRYQSLVNELSQDVYLTDELLGWALDVE